MLRPCAPGPAFGTWDSVPIARRITDSQQPERRPSPEPLIMANFGKPSRSDPHPEAGQTALLDR